MVPHNKQQLLPPHIIPDHSMASLVQDQVRSKPVGSSVISMTSSATSTTNCSASVVNTSHQLTLLISSFSFPTTCCKFYGDVWGYLVKLKTRQRNDNLDNAITREEAMRSLEASLVRVWPHITNEDFESIVTKAGRCSCYLVLLCGCAPYWRLTMSSSLLWCNQDMAQIQHNSC